MQVLVMGRHGQLATELARQDRSDRRVRCWGREQANLLSVGAARAAIDQAGDVDAVINAAAYTDVDGAESNAEAAHRINAQAPAEMATACAERGIPLVHVSTDYVFDGHGHSAWQPQDPVRPLGVYGQTKRAGEQAVAAAGGVHVILRTAWVFSAHGRNFVKTMRRLGASQHQVNVVADQIGGPTPADALAAACLGIAEALLQQPERLGIYHFSGVPWVSWAELAREVMARSGSSCAVAEVTTADYPTTAERPLNSRLDSERTEQAFGIPAPDWRAGLDRVLGELERYQG